MTADLIIYTNHYQHTNICSPQALFHLKKSVTKWHWTSEFLLGRIPVITCQFLTGESPHMPMGIQQPVDPEQNCYSSWLCGFSPTFLNSCSFLLFSPLYFVNPRRRPRCTFTFMPFLLIVISADSLFPTYSQTNSHSLWTPLWMSSMPFLCDKLW